MSVVAKYYLAVASIAERTGLASARYRVRDGRFVLSFQDLKLVRFTPEEMMNGIGDYIEEVAEQDAKALIAENGYKLGVSDEKNENISEEALVPEEKEEETTNEEEE